jgi:hypothetical protein
MTIDWGIIPVDPDNQGMREWLQKESIDIPPIQGRFPTLDELLSVLGSLGDLPVDKLDHGSGLVTISLGDQEETGYALISGRITTEGYFGFFFDGWRNEKMTMVKILQKLSVFCGPLILREQYGATPILITRDTNLDLALQDWHNRFHKKYPE